MAWSFPRRAEATGRGLEPKLAAVCDIFRRIRVISTAGGVSKPLANLAPRSDSAPSITIRGNVMRSRRSVPAESPPSEHSALKHSNGAHSLAQRSNQVAPRQVRGLVTLALTRKKGGLYCLSTNFSPLPLPLYSPPSSDSHGESWNREALSHLDRSRPRPEKSRASARSGIGAAPKSKEQGPQPASLPAELVADCRLHKQCLGRLLHPCGSGVVESDA